MEILEFQSKPTKETQFKYRRQKDGMFKSNGKKGGLYARSVFNSENPVLEVEYEGKIFKVGTKVNGIGTIKKMKAQNGTVLLTGTQGEREIDQIEVEKVNRIEDIKKKIIDNFKIGFCDSKEHKFSCGIKEYGNFPNDTDFQDDIADILEDYAAYHGALSNEEKTIIDSNEFRVELIEKVYGKEIDFKENFTITVNNQDQSLRLAYFENVAKKNDKVTLFPIIGNTTGNRLTLILCLGRK